MLTDQFKAKQMTTESTPDGEFLYFEVKEKVLEKLQNHCDKLIIQLMIID